MASSDERLAQPAEKPLTISALGRRFGVSRSTLLYYDKLGLLAPSGRTAAGYRLYSVADITRLTRIMELRAAGMPLEQIQSVLDSRSSLSVLLQQQLLAVNAQMQLLREQQAVLLAMLGQPGEQGMALRLSKDAWTEMFRRIGMSDDEMWRWHAAFEQSRPEAHQLFLESLGVTASEITRIRQRSRELVV